MVRTLTLEVIGSEAAGLGSARRHVFSSSGGVIGRVKTCDWVLSHTKVSGRHAVITAMDGVFYIEDTSTNGVFLNSPRNRLVAGRRYALESGDQLIIEPYHISIQITGDRDVDAGIDDSRVERHANRERTPAPVIDDPFADLPAQAPLRRTPPAGYAEPLEPEPVASEELDPLKLLGGDEPRRSPVRRVPTADELDRGPAMSGHYTPPTPVMPTPVPTPPPASALAPAPFVIPADYDPLRDDFVATAPVIAEPPAPVRVPEPPPPPVEPEVEDVTVDEPAIEAPPPTPVPSPVRPRPAPVPVVAASGVESADTLRALLDGAGLREEVPVTKDLAHSFGRIFRIVVSGVMDVLRSRQDIKDEFRMRMTQFRPADNNPLKFSANVDDALHNLLVKRNPAYLQPVDAFEDAFDDLRYHQLAMLAGMRVAFESMLAQFEPDRLEKQFVRQLQRIPILRVMTRLRYWQLYRDRFEDMARDQEETFKKLFGEEFARAYEEQLARLKAEGEAGHSTGSSPRGSRS
jgi:type VI secretion system FHA domain protein